jgi:hypothetical protein
MQETVDLSEPIVRVVHGPVPQMCRSLNWQVHQDLARSRKEHGVTKGSP